MTISDHAVSISSYGVTVGGTTISFSSTHSQTTVAGGGSTNTVCEVVAASAIPSCSIGYKTGPGSRMITSRPSIWLIPFAIALGASMYVNNDRARSIIAWIRVLSDLRVTGMTV